MYALAAVQWDVPNEEALTGYLWSWCESQVAAAIKLVPLGQTSGQRILLSLGSMIPEWIHTAQNLVDDEVGASLPGLARASSLHESQYCRLFRS
jgi:urease accessory protein